MFLFNNLRVGNKTPTDYRLGNTEIQKMYLGDYLIFDRAAVEVRYTFETSDSTNITIGGGSSFKQITIQSYKETYINGVPQGDKTILDVSLQDIAPTWAVFNKVSTSNGYRYTIDFLANTTDDTRSFSTYFIQEESSKTLNISVTQTAREITYGPVVITSFSYPNVVPAKGGMTEGSSPSIEYYQTYGYNGQTTGGGTITSGATFSYQVLQDYGVQQITANGTVYGYNLEDQIKSQTVIGNIQVTVHLNDKTNTATAQVKQQENKIESYTYNNVNISVEDIPASGGTAVFNIDNDIQFNATYTSTYQGNETISNSYATVNKQITAESRGTTTGTRLFLDTATVTLNYKGCIKEYYVDVYQAKNDFTSTDPDISFQYSDVPAAGGDVYPQITATYRVTYDSGEYIDYSEENMTFQYILNQLISPTAEVNSTTGAVSEQSLGTIDKERSEIIKVRLQYKRIFDGSFSYGPTTSVYQEANVATYGDLLGAGLSVSDVPASGSPIPTPVLTTPKQNVTYTSGASRQGVISDHLINFDTSTITNLGTTVKPRTKVITASVTWYGEGEKTATAYADVYQEANVRTLTSTETGDWVVQYGMDINQYGTTYIPVEGGSYELIKSCTRTITYNYSYTSGSTNQVQDTENAMGNLQVQCSSTQGDFCSSYSITDDPYLVARFNSNAKNTDIRSGTLNIYIMKDGSAEFDAGPLKFQQRADTILETTYTDIDLQLTADPMTISEDGGQSTISYTAVATKTVQWDSGASDIEEDFDISDQVELSMTTDYNTYFNLSDNILTAEANNNTENKECTITASVLDTSKSVTITLQGIQEYLEFNRSSIPTIAAEGDNGSSTGFGISCAPETTAWTLILTPFNAGASLLGETTAGLNFMAKGTGPTTTTAFRVSVEPNTDTENRQFTLQLFNDDDLSTTVDTLIINQEGGAFVTGEFLLHQVTTSVGLNNTEQIAFNFPGILTSYILNWSFQAQTINRNVIVESPDEPITFIITKTSRLTGEITIIAEADSMSLELDGTYNGLSVTSGDYSSGYKLVRFVFNNYFNSISTPVNFTLNVNDMKVPGIIKNGAAS